MYTIKKSVDTHNRNNNKNKLIFWVVKLPDQELFGTVTDVDKVFMQFPHHVLFVSDLLWNL